MWVGALLALSSRAEPRMPGGAARQALLEGVRSLDCPGVPGGLALWADGAVPLATGRLGAVSVPFAAAGFQGKGRVVALGHDGCLTDEALAHGDARRLLTNAVAWLAPAARPPRVGVVSLFDAPRVVELVEGRRLPGEGFGEALKALDVLVLTSNALTPDDARALGAFVTRGGGLLVAHTGWGWQQLRGGPPMTQDALNLVLAPSGLGWTSSTLERASGAGFSLSPPPLDGSALVATRALLDGTARDDELDIVSALALDGAELLPLTRPDVMVRVAAEAKARGLADPTPARPLRRHAALDRYLLLLALAPKPPEQTRALAAAATFPGAVPEAPPVTATLRVDLAVPAWTSTGLYARPGVPLRVTTPTGASAGLRVRIGCHTDDLTRLDEWHRAPRVSQSWPLRDGTTDVASPTGGLVYVEVPPNARGVAVVKVAGAVQAPFFKLNETSPERWRQLRQAPAPWAELASDKVVLSVPSSAVRALDDPEALLRAWDRVLDGAADLAGSPRARATPERYVADVQLGAGFMHSGYPMMTHLEAAPRLVSAQVLARGEWGFFHELGHNHQAPEWTFEGTGEVTNNLFTLYLFDTLTTTKRQDAHEAFKTRREARARHFAAGAPFAAWKADPFLALFMYCELQEAFGWAPFQRVFAEYRDLPEAQRPRTDDEKRDQWLVRLSRAVKRDLGPFFVAWGVPTSERARREVASLPPWRP